MNNQVNEVARKQRDVQRQVAAAEKARKTDGKKAAADRRARVSGSALSETAPGQARLGSEARPGADV